jgi:hypothetical protein
MQANAAAVLMAHSAKVVGAIIIAALTTTKAMSETVVFSCEFVGPPENSGRREAAVDRVVVNYEARQIDFQVAKTMGTKEELDWTLKDRKEYDDQFNIRKSSDDEFVGMGTVGGLPTMVTFKRKALRWVTLTSRGDVDIDMLYRCLK